MKKCYKHHNNLYILTAKQTFFSSVSCHRTLSNDFGKLYKAVHYFFGLPKAGLLFFFCGNVVELSSSQKKRSHMWCKVQLDVSLQVK